MIRSIMTKIYDQMQQHTIRVRLMLLISTSIGMIFFVMVGLYTWHEWEQTLQGSKRLLVHSLHMQLQSIQDWYRDRFDDVEIVSRLRVVRSQDVEGMAHDFDASLVNNQDFIGYVFVDHSGVTLVDSIAPTGTNVKDREYYFRGMQGEPFITDVIVGRATGRKIIIISQPVFDYRNYPIGIVFATVSIDKLTKIMEQFQVGHTGIAYLIDSKGSIVAQSRKSEQAISTMQNNEGFQKALTGSSGVTIYTNHMGRSVVGAYQWIAERNWVILCEMDKDEILFPFYKLLTIGIGSGVFIMLVAFYFTWLLSRTIQRPIRLLFAAAQRTQSGEYSQAIPEEKFISAPVEIRGLCDAFNIMMGTIQEHIALLHSMHEAVAAAENKYRLLSTKDQLTQIYNRTYFEAEVSRLQSLQQVPIAAIVFDVDGLKLMNDMLGHKAGDALIRAAAECIMKSFGMGDTVARVGGDEFVVLMPGADHAAMEEGIKQVRLVVAEHNQTQPHLPLAISMGGALATDLPLELEDTISQADNRMYQEKNSNRDEHRSIMLTALR